jgi:hypothetical protein
MTEIKIALSTNTMLNFPFYLLESDPVSYGLNDIKITLDSKDGDTAALESLEDGYHFSVCDPAKLHNQATDSGVITKCAIKPIIVKTALWGLTSNSELAKIGTNTKLLEGMRDSKLKDYFSSIHTYHSGTTAYRSLEYLSNLNDFVNIQSTNIITEHRIIGEELKKLKDSDDIELVVTSDILAVEMYRNSKKVHKVIDFYNLDIDVFNKSVFTALITNTNLIKTNDELIEKMIQAIDEILIAFNNSSKKELGETARKIFEYNKLHNVFNKEKLTVMHITNALNTLKNDNIYPSKNYVNGLCQYWENTCVIWNKNDSKSNTNCKKVPNNNYIKLWKRRGFSKKIEKISNKYNNNWLPLLFAIFVPIILMCINVIFYYYDEIEEEKYFNNIMIELNETRNDIKNIKNMINLEEE